VSKSATTTAAAVISWGMIIVGCASPPATRLQSDPWDTIAPRLDERAPDARLGIDTGTMLFHRPPRVGAGHGSE
jgi:hypothetical protein